LGQGLHKKKVKVMAPQPGKSEQYEFNRTEGTQEKNPGGSKSRKRLTSVKSMLRIYIQFGHTGGCEKTAPARVVLNKKGGITRR